MLITVEQVLFNSYRSLAVTSVLYRLLLYCEATHGDPGRRGSRGSCKTVSGLHYAWKINFFVVTQAIEIAAREKRDLMLAFLDISRAHDCGAPGRVFPQTCGKS